METGKHLLSKSDAVKPKEKRTRMTAKRTRKSDVFGVV